MNNRIIIDFQCIAHTDPVPDNVGHSFERSISAESRRGKPAKAHAGPPQNAGLTIV